MIRSLSLSAMLLLLAAPLSAQAQEGRTGFSFGALATADSAPYLGQDSEGSIVPLIRYQGNGFSIGTDGAFVTLLDRPAGRLEALATPRFSALDGADAPELAGIDRDITLDLGLRYTMQLGNGADLRATLLQEVTGEHDGQELDLRISQDTQAGRVPLTFFAGAAWRSADLSAYLYGVRPSEATGTRPAYAPGATLTPYIGAGARVPLGQSLSLFGAVRADYLSDAITDSPIIADRSAVSATMGLQFSF